MGGKYSKIKSIGAGRYGKVFIVRDLTGNKYAMKQIQLNKLNRETDYSNARSQEENMIRLNSEYTVKIYQAIYTEDKVQFILELCDKSLNEIYKQISDHRKSQFTMQIVQGVQYLHSENTIHRDLKLQNILVKKTQRKGYILKISDFGLSKKLYNQMSTVKNYGTQNYSAPECLKSSQRYISYNKAADCWALGLILMQLWLGKRAQNFCEGHSIPAQNPSFPNKANLQKIKSKQKRQVIEKLLQRDPKKRLTAQQAFKLLSINHNPIKSKIVGKDYWHINKQIALKDKKTTHLRICQQQWIDIEIKMGIWSEEVIKFGKNISMFKQLRVFQYQFNHSLDRYFQFTSLVESLNQLKYLSSVTCKMKKFETNEKAEPNWLENVKVQNKHVYQE